ncbi:hypothetical protein PG991_016173 [Apiospora marii]|uniref:Phosphoglycerate mutase family protein n=1 Tax=Apiospora marii TaxID=335849 RepID=A0ABR1R0X1_9PEZI
MRLFFTFLLLAATFVAAAAKPTVYFIRHGEKPKKGDGLNSDGVKRAQCLRGVFGVASDYNITHVMAQRPKKNGKQKRPYDTVLPLATDMGLDVDTSCKRDDIDCVVDIIKNYKGDGNILICWEHKRMKDVAKALGVKKFKKYPKKAFNLIYEVPPKYKKVAAISSENCRGLDR